MNRPSTHSSAVYNIHHPDESSSYSTAPWRRHYNKQNDDSTDQDESPSSYLLPDRLDELPSMSKGSSNKNITRRTVISIRILGIVILISLFSWFYLQSLAGGNIEWVKDHLSMLGVNLALSVLCLTVALTMIALTPMSTKFAICLIAGVVVILYALKTWDDGESFEQHGAYNFLVLLVITVPLNGLTQSIMLCQRKMPPQKFHRFMTVTVSGVTLTTTLLLMYYHSIWGTGANGAHLMHGNFGGAQLCEWDGLNIPVVDLLPNNLQNFWTGRLTCPPVTGIEAEWTYDGVLTINCLNKGFRASGQQPTYDILPDTRSFSVKEKLIGTYNKKIVERIKHVVYTEPVLVNEEGVESIVANCEENVSKVLIRLTRDMSVLARVKEARQEHVRTAEKENTPSFRRPNVMVLFMDAVSRRQFYRKLTNTAAVVASLDKSAQGGPQLHEFFRYHAIGFNTDNNSRAIYSDYSGPLGPTPVPIWTDFYEAGYITSRVDDNCEDWSAQYIRIATSQYFDHELQSPFCLPPYYALEGNPFSNFEGPYSIVSRCLHGTNVHNHAMEYMNQFRRAYPDQPWFQMGSFIEGHEGTGEVLLTLDDSLAKFIKGMEEDGSLENTIIFMLADHGLHMGINFMFTPNGRIEHMNPYLSVILPPLVTKMYPSLSRGLMHNQQSLITGHDVYSTLKMLASGVMPENGDKDNGEAWRKGTLFDEGMNPGRTCEQAQVPEVYCRCRA